MTLSRSTAQPDYARVCVDCMYYVRVRGDHPVHAHKCFRSCDLVTGDARPSVCAYARARDGHCGPNGRGWVEMERAIVKEAAE